MLSRASIPPKPIMHIAYSPISTKFIYFTPYFQRIINSPYNGLIYGFLLSSYFPRDTFTHHALYVGLLDTRYVKLK